MHVIWHCTIKVQGTGHPIYPVFPKFIISNRATHDCIHACTYIIYMYIHTSVARSKGFEACYKQRTEPTTNDRRITGINPSISHWHAPKNYWIMLSNWSQCTIKLGHCVKQPPRLLRPFTSSSNWQTPYYTYNLSHASLLICRDNLCMNIWPSAEGNYIWLSCKYAWQCMVVILIMSAIGKKSKKLRDRNWFNYRIW